MARPCFSLPAGLLLAIANTFLVVYIVKRLARQGTKSEARHRQCPVSLVSALENAKQSAAKSCNICAPKEMAAVHVRTKKGQPGAGA